MRKILKMRTPENVRLKIIELRGTASRAEFAKEFKTKDYTVRGIEEGKQNVPYELALLLEEKYKISHDWLLTGKGSMFLDEKRTPEEILDSWGLTLDLTEKEKLTLATALTKDKGACFYLFAALDGDTVALEKLKKLIC